MTNQVDRFHAAVSVLAGNGKVKQRLMRAYEAHLEAIEDDELPTAVKQDFAGLRSLMHRVAPSNGEGPVCASVRKMSVEEAKECAISVVALYRDILRAGDDGQASLLLDHGERKVVPPFLVKTN